MDVAQLRRRMRRWLREHVDIVVPIAIGAVVVLLAVSVFTFASGLHT